MNRLLLAIILMLTFSSTFASLSEELAKEDTFFGAENKSPLKYGYVCMTETTLKVEDKTQRLVCLKSKRAPESSVCFCKDNLNKTKKNVPGKIVTGSRVNTKIANLKSSSTGPGGICYLMPKWMGSKGETAWYCSNDAFTSHDSKELCESSCIGI